MPTRNAQATWEGGLKGGKGSFQMGSGAFKGAYSFATRFEQQPGTNPEELIAAAHAACFSMALSAALEKAGHQPQRVQTTAQVTLDKVDTGFKITRIKLNTQATVPGMDEKTFLDVANKAKTGCPVSQALAATPIDLEAKLA